jgi:hypothetical protein
MNWFLRVIASTAAAFGVEWGEAAPQAPLLEQAEQPQRSSVSDECKESIEAGLREAERAAENGYTEEALELVRHVSRGAPGRPEPSVLETRIALAAGRFEEAVDAFVAMPRQRHVPEEVALASALARLELEHLAEAGRVDVRAAAIVALGRADDPEAIAPLVDAQWGDAPDGGGRLAELVGRTDTAMRPLFEEFTKRDRSDLKLIGAAGLLGLGEAGAVVPLARAIRGPDIGQSSFAADLARTGRLVHLAEPLRERARARDDSGAAAMAALAVVTEDAGERFRILRALRRTALTTTAAKSAAAARAIDALGALEGEEAHAALVVARGGGTVEERRLRAARQLAARGDTTVAEELARKLVAPARPPAWQDARAVGRLAIPSVLDALRPHLGDPASPVSPAIAVAFGRAGRIREHARELIQCLAHVRARGASEERLEVASAIYDPNSPSMALIRPKLIRRVRMNFGPPCGDVDPELSRWPPSEALDGADSCLRALREAFRFERCGGGGVVVWLREDLSPSRLEEIRENLLEAGYDTSLDVGESESPPSERSDSCCPAPHDPGHVIP